MTMTTEKIILEKIIALAPRELIITIPEIMGLTGLSREEVEDSLAHLTALGYIEIPWRYGDVFKSVCNGGPDPEDLLAACATLNYSCRN
jgi:hypothetical protein